MTSGPIARVIDQWHDYLRGSLDGGLDALLDDDVVFYSPVVYTPQVGKALTLLYLSAARQTFPGDDADVAASTADDVGGSFRYTKHVLDGDTAVLEFETTMDGKYVNGVDIIRCNDEGRIVEFRVMVRPLQGVNAVHEQMRTTLERMAPRA
jgi:SnoaL-like domain